MVLQGQMTWIIQTHCTDAQALFFLVTFYSLIFYTYSYNYVLRRLCTFPTTNLSVFQSTKSLAVDFYVSKIDFLIIRSHEVIKKSRIFHDFVIYTQWKHKQHASFHIQTLYLFPTEFCLWNVTCVNGIWFILFCMKIVLLFGWFPEIGDPVLTFRVVYIYFYTHYFNLDIWWDSFFTKAILWFVVFILSDWRFQNVSLAEYSFPGFI